MVEPKVVEKVDEIKKVPQVVAPVAQPEKLVEQKVKKGKKKEAESEEEYYDSEDSDDK